MTQPTERRFVMEPRLDAEVEAINADKISHGTVVNSDVASNAAIDKTKIAGTAITAADTGTVTSTIIADGTIQSTDLDVLDYVKFDTTYTGGSTQPGMINWNDTDGTLEFQLKGGNVTLQVGQEQVVRVKNNTGSTLSNGKAVYISGSNGNNLLADYANATSEPKSSGTIGITTEDINSNGHGYVTTFGLVRNINTAGLTEGAPVWLSTTDGGFTSTRPTAPNHSVVLGFCLRASATVGVIFVRVDNGWELDELHNVLISSPVNGQALTYDNGVWKNSTPASTLNDLTDVTINSGTLSGGQVIKYDAGTTQWVNGPAAGGVTASATAPNLATSAAGDAWFDTNDGTLYVCYVDTDSTKQWVQVQANSALEASILSRLGALESQAIAYGQLSPNYLLNADFSINQRGFTSTTTNGGYGFDRWHMAAISGATYSAQTFTPGAAPVAGYEAKNFARIVTSGQTGANMYTILRQLIEDVRLLAGKTITISFWAKAASGTPRVAVELEQNFGTGGTPSGAVTVNAGQVTLSTSWARYSVTVAVPGLSGKTVGTTDNTSNTLLSLFVSAGTDYNARTGSLGIQSNTFDFWGIQVEQGSVATAFRRNAPSIQAELAACQRYYQRYGGNPSNITICHGTVSTGTNAVTYLPLMVEMRTAPTFSRGPLASFRQHVPGVILSTPTFLGLSISGPKMIQIDSTAGSGFTPGHSVKLESAGTDGIIELSAEF